MIYNTALLPGSPLAPPLTGLFTDARLLTTADRPLQWGVFDPRVCDVRLRHVCSGAFSRTQIASLPFPLPRWAAEEVRRRGPECAGPDRTARKSARTVSSVVTVRP
ncbi:hypothetical protein EDD98_5739 [Streptomyces sp. PanSC19]|nr:hypothetical protein EDD98_5739 [Streptomyces sp. PanSC19]